MRRWVVAFGVVALVLLISLVWNTRFRGTPPERALGAGVLAVIDAPDSVVSFRLLPERATEAVELERRRSDPNARLVGNRMLITSDGPALSSEQAGWLRRAIHDEKSYRLSPSAVKPCGPMPGVTIRFIRDGRSVDVALCFECNIWQFYDGDRYLFGEDFDPIEQPLIDLVKSLFPDDPVIQGLKGARG